MGWALIALLAIVVSGCTFNGTLDWVQDGQEHVSRYGRDRFVKEESGMRFSNAQSAPPQAWQISPAQSAPPSSKENESGWREWLAK